MIREISIANFRCYERLELTRLGRLNIITGDNGSGKTALLEAIFLALAATPEIAVRYRQQRGMDGVLGGSARRIEEGLWGDLFYRNDLSRTVSIRLRGSGPEARCLEISRGGGETLLPLIGGETSDFVTAAPVRFIWTDAQKIPRSVVPKILPTGQLQLQDTGEDLPNFFFIPAGASISSSENAARLSELSKSNLHERFIKAFVKEYNWITDLSVEVNVGAPAIFATLKGGERKIPLANVSAGVNRMMTIMLAIASLKRSVVIVDEIENGIFHSHLTSMWKTFLALLDEYECQLFVSTHSQECLEAIVRAAGKAREDIVFLQAQRGDIQSTIRSLSAKILFAGIQLGEEVR